MWTHRRKYLKAVLRRSLYMYIHDSIYSPVLSRAVKVQLSILSGLIDHWVETMEAYVVVHASQARRSYRISILPVVTV